METVVVPAVDADCDFDSDSDVDADMDADANADALRAVEDARLNGQTKRMRMQRAAVAAVPPVPLPRPHCLQCVNIVEPEKRVGWGVRGK